MAIEFYNVKTRSKVSVEESQVVKVVYTPNSGTPRYAVRTEQDGVSLTRFVSREFYKKLDAPAA